MDPDEELIDIGSEEEEEEEMSVLKSRFVFPLFFFILFFIFIVQDLHTSAQ